MEGGEGWWLSGGRSSVVGHWWLKLGAPGSITGDDQLFTFPRQKLLSIQVHSTLTSDPPPTCVDRM